MIHINQKFSTGGDLAMEAILVGTRWGQGRYWH